MNITQLLCTISKKKKKNNPAHANLLSVNVTLFLQITPSII